MKLTCDLCGGELQMQAGGQRACCANCGLEYSQERLVEMLKDNTQVRPEVKQEQQEPRIRKLFLKRKFNLSGCAVKAAVYLDGEQCAILGARTETCVPISEGPHEIVVRLATGAGLVELNNVSFQVADYDVCGLLYLKQTAFTASWVFEVQKVL